MTKYERMQQIMQGIPPTAVAATHVLRQALVTAPVVPESYEAIALRVKEQQAAEQVVQRTTLARARRKYEGLVRKLTDAQDLSSVPNIHLRAFRQYDLDHIISIWDGFKMGLPAAALASVSNLRIIPHIENSRKGRASDLAAHPLAGLLIPCV